MSRDPSMRRGRFPAGIVGEGLHEISREYPTDEPPPLPPNDRLAVIGKPVRRLDARAKVTGATRFTVDLRLPGMLAAAILRSPHAHARVLSIDTSAAAALPGVRAVLALAVPGNPQRQVLRYVGMPVAAVAATSPELARQALRRIRVDYEVLPCVAGLEQARRVDSPPVYEGDAVPRGHASGYPAPPDLPLHGNVRGPAVQRRGDVERGFAEADVVVEAEYRTQVQTHCCLEPHAIVAEWQPQGLTVHMSTQFTAGVRRELAQSFGLPLERVRVLVDGMGGGFGSKSSLGGYGRIAVLLSRHAAAPVRLVLDREEEQTDSGNRPSTWQHLRIGARRDGRLSAIALNSHGSAGVALGAGVGDFAASLYDCPNFLAEHYDVFTNAGPGCAMRGPGNTPGAFAVEQAVDELAERLGIDPLELRDRIDPSPVRREERRIGRERIDWGRRLPAGAAGGVLRRGIGVAQSTWMANVQTDSSCEVRVLRDGGVEVLSSVQDIGSGIRTVLAQVVAEVLGLRAEQVTVRIGDTDFPAGPPSYGSRTTASITPPARTAAWQVLQQLLRAAAPALHAHPDELVARDGRIEPRGAPAGAISFAQAAALLRTERISAVASRSDDYGGFKRRFGDAALARQDLGGVQFAEVVVDTRTGVIHVERVVAVQDCGRPMNPLQLESQVHGGVLMGLSYALYEERVLDPRNARMLNPDLEQYKLAGVRETPRIDVVVLENYQGNSATDAYGIAEPANIATAPAIANAVYNALGVRLRTLPMTPAAVLGALQRTS